MSTQRRSGMSRVTEEPEELSHVPLQAVLLADSFAQKFRPITLERPKVLLPLVNIPMIDYTLAWLESAGVEEVFVFCCAHSKQIIAYLEESDWYSQPNFCVTTIESHNSVSAGDALRLIYERNVIQGDFVLISGDTVSNMSLTKALQEHKDRKKKDNFAVLTMVIKQSKPSPITHQSRLGTDELFMAIDPDTKQLVYYEDKADYRKGTICLEKNLVADNPSISLHNDMEDCYIDICSPEVLSLFTDNFDYQHLRRHFVKGLLVDDIMGYKIFTHEIKSSYAARIDNFRSYDTISKDIIQRWTYPLVPDVMFAGNSAAKLDRQGIYRASEISLSRSALIGPCSVIGKGTSIGKNTKVLNSVIGEGCVIGSDISIEGCYVWNNVTIENGCKLRHALICDGVVLKSGAELNPGVVLSFNVVIGQQFEVPAYSKVSLLQQPSKQDSDEELEYADQNSGTLGSSFAPTSDELKRDSASLLPNSPSLAASEVGAGGAGYIWSSCDGSVEEELRHSVAPIPADKLVKFTQVYDDDPDDDVNVLPLSRDFEPNPDSDDNENTDDEEPKDEYGYFEREVEATFLRAVNENVKEDHIVLEVNSLRLASDMSAHDCAGALFYSVIKLALDTPHISASELHRNAATLISKWQKLLKYYLQTLDEEIEVIMKLEEMCLQFGELSPLFAQILHLLYDKDILKEEAILAWASEREGADEADKVFVKQSENFIKWLNEASEEEDDED